MPSEDRFPFERVARLDSPERQARQPPDRLAELVAADNPGRVLDIGVGTGYFGLELARRLPEALVLGLDIEPRMLELFAARAAEAGFSDRIELHQTPREDPDSVPLPDHSVDAAVQANLYHELDDRLHHLREIHRVLRTGGLLVLTDWDPEGAPETGPPAKIRVPAEVVEAELIAAGFGNLRRHAMYPDSYVISAQA